MPAGRPRADRIDLSQPVIAGFFSQAGGARAPARPVLQRKDGEATGAQVASATAGNLVTLDPATETLGKWVARQAALRGFPSRQNYGTERNRALIALYEAEVVADADRAIPMARIRQQAVEDEARMYAEKREAERRETEEANAAATAVRVEVPSMAALMDLIAAMPLTSCSAERIFSKMRLVGSRLRKLLKEPELNRLLFVGVETPWDEGRGIPTDVMDDIISAWICANGTASGERKLMCVPLQRYLDCVTAARRWRDHEQRTRAALATISTQTDESPPVLVPNLAQAALNPERLIF
jgi:hypothetical protein